MLYELRVSTYSAPDRGDPDGGWYPQDPWQTKAKSDKEAKKKAKEYVARIYGANHKELRTNLYQLRRVPLK